MGPGAIPWGPTALAWWPGRRRVEWKRWDSALAWWGRQDDGQGGPQPRVEVGDVRGAGRVWPGRPWQGGSSEGQRRVLREGRGRLFKAEERRGVKSGLGWRHQRNRLLRVILLGPGGVPWGPTALAWWPWRRR